MNSNTLTFDTENLVVDYITFKFQEAQCDQNTIADYLFNLGFNSYQESGKSTKPIKQPIFIDSTNQHEISFIHDNFHWKGTLIHFSGLNAARFYFLAKQNIINWKIFDQALLSRFDIHYSRENTITDKISSTDFLYNLYIKLKSTTKTLKLEKNLKGTILKIGNRRSNHCSRIYQRPNSLRFELEMKGRILQNYHNLLAQNQLHEFEQNISSHFVLYFGKILTLQYSYTDWLAEKLRPIRQQRFHLPSLNSDYIKHKTTINPKSLVKFLQLLNYVQDLDYEITDWDRVLYRKVTFRVRDFIKFLNPTISTTNRYQIQKTKDFFKELLTGVQIDSFTSSYFQTLVAIPRVEFEISSQQKHLLAHVWLVEKLFYYDYPFFFPNFFQENLTKHQFYVRFSLLKTFCSIDIEKIILVDQFIHDYPSTLNNNQKTKIKQSFLELVQILKENNLIESKYKYIHKGKYHSVDQLTINNIWEGFIIYEKLIL